MIKVFFVLAASIACFFYLIIGSMFIVILPISLLFIFLILYFGFKKWIERAYIMILAIFYIPFFSNSYPDYQSYTEQMVTIFPKEDRILSLWKHGKRSYLKDLYLSLRGVNIWMFQLSDQDHDHVMSLYQQANKRSEVEKDSIREKLITFNLAYEDVQLNTYTVSKAEDFTLYCYGITEGNLLREKKGIIFEKWLDRKTLIYQYLPETKILYAYQIYVDR
jgi:hypothetical protein